VRRSRRIRHTSRGPLPISAVRAPRRRSWGHRNWGSDDCRRRPIFVAALARGHSHRCCGASGHRFGFCLSYAFSVRRIFGENFGLNYAHNWLGFGLAVACTIDGSSHRGWCGSVCFGAHRGRAPVAIHTWNGANQSGIDEYGRDDYGGLPVKQGHRASVNRRMLYLHRWGCS